jgi:hypothetical protein
MYMLMRLSSIAEQILQSLMYQHVLSITYYCNTIEIQIPTFFTKIIILNNQIFQHI